MPLGYLLLVLGGRSGRGWNVFDDEHLFARLDQAKLAARHVFDGCRILSQPARLVGQPRIDSSIFREIGGQHGVLSSHAQHREQAPIARQCVKHDHCGDKRETDVQQAPVPRAAADRLRFSVS